MKWLKDHGTEWVKVCAEPGDLLICEFILEKIKQLRFNT
jgi:hypothetical protein